MVQLNFDASNVEQFEGFSVKPPGWYNVMIDASEMLPTKNGDGAYLKLQFDILDGQYKGQKFFDQLTLKHPNPQTVEIAYKKLSSIAHAVGILQVQDSQQLHGRPLKVKVKKKPADGQYDESNDITSYKNINEQVEMAGGAVPGNTAPSFTPPPAQQPWAQPAQQQPSQFAPPAAPPVDQAANTWTPPGGAQQPWTQPPANPPQQPAQSTTGTAPWQAPATGAPAPAAPATASPSEQQHPAQQAAPPWAQPPQGS